MKKIAIYCFTVILALTMLVLPAVQEKAEAATAIPILVNGEKVKFEVEPIQTEGTTLVQFTPIFQKLDLFFQWDSGTKTVTAVKEGLKIELTVGKKQAIVNGRVTTLQVAPRIVKGKMFIPLRLVSEATGASIIIKNNTIMIATADANSNPNTGSNTNTNTTTVQTPETVATTKNSNSSSKVTAADIVNDLNKNKSQLMYDGIKYNVNYLVEIWDANSIAITMLYDLEGMDDVLDANTQNLKASIYMTAPIANDLHNKYQYSSIYVFQAYRGIYDSDPSGPGNDMMHEPVHVKYVGGKYVVTAEVFSTLFEYKTNKATLVFDPYGGYPSTIDVVTIP